MKYGLYLRNPPDNLSAFAPVLKAFADAKLGVSGCGCCQSPWLDTGDALIECFHVGPTSDAMLLWGDPALLYDTETGEWEQP